MKIRLLATKFKPEHMMHWDEFINLTGESLFADKWKTNPYVQQDPFFKDSLRIIDNKVVASLSNYQMQNGVPKLSKKIIRFFPHEKSQLIEAATMLKFVRTKVHTILYDNKLPFEILMDDGSIKKSAEVNNGIWMTHGKRIFCTGYFPAKRIGKRRWGRLFFDKKIVVKNMALFTARNLNPFPVAEGIPMMASYLKELGAIVEHEQRKYNEECAIEDSRAKHPINISKNECYDFLEALAKDLHQWKFERKNHYNAVLSKVDTQTKKILGIDQRGSPGISAIQRRALVVPIIEKVRAHIFTKSTEIDSVG